MVIEALKRRPRRGLVATAAVALLAVAATAGGYAAAATSGGSARAGEQIPTITVGLPPPIGTPTSAVPVHTTAPPGLGRTSVPVREGQTLLSANRYVAHATDGQRLLLDRADEWLMRNGTLYGVSLIVHVATPVDGERWLPIISHTDGDVYNPKWVHLKLEHVSRYRALIDLRHRRVASFLPLIPDEKPPYELIDPKNLNANIAAVPPH
jgi:hypothetical protein